MPEVRYQKTTLSRSGARVAIGAAFRTRFAREATRNELAMLLAQSEHETGGWAHMPNFNFAGVKASKKWIDADPRRSFVRLKTSEGAGRNKVEIRDSFRAFGFAVEGAFDWLSALAYSWPSALVQAGLGDVDAYVSALLHGGLKRAYFTGDRAQYTTIMRRNFARWHTELPADTFPATEEPTLPAASLPSPVQAWPEGTYVTVPGYHRPKQGEVTAIMYAMALASLHEMKLGDIKYFQGFALGCETHSNATKGISVFLPDEVSK